MEYLFMNGHLHTPYSFCCFDSLAQAVKMAKEENIAALGINDFFTTDGYDEWFRECVTNGIHPMFNFEFIGVSIEEQANNIRINDPGNPGRIYMSGKGLAYPFKLDEPYASQFLQVKESANVVSRAIIAKLNEHLTTVEAGFQLSFAKTLLEITKGMVRERHIAQRIREKVFEFASSDADRIAVLEKIFSKSVTADINDTVALENEIRSVLLKSGGVAFIPEDPESFLPMDNVRDIIINGKGIPTYPLLGNALKGKFTEFEEDKDKLLATLKEKQFYAVEFITSRNTTAMLEDYAQFFVDNGFVVTFGSEHNTPLLERIRLKTADDDYLSDKLRKINYEGCCIIIAHQKMIEEGKQGWLDAQGAPDTSLYSEFVDLGDKLIKG